MNWCGPLLFPVRTQLLGKGSYFPRSERAVLRRVGLMIARARQVVANGLRERSKVPVGWAASPATNCDSLSHSLECDSLSR